MSGPRLIHQHRETPPELATAPGRRRALPSDLLRQASHRVEIISLIGAALWVLAPGLGHLALHARSPDDPRWAQFTITDAVALVGLLTSLGTFVYLRIRERDPLFVMDLALWYMIATAIDIGLLFHLNPPGADPPSLAPMITWIGPVILMFAAIVPTEPRKMLMAGLVAASMDPLGMLLARMFGRTHFDSIANALFMHYPNYLLLGVAVVISHVVTRLGQQVTKERELGSYRLVELLGKGGMGEVYRATHHMLARPAAIKLIRPEVLASRDGGLAELAIVRFRREAEAAASLRSPHSVELYDFGVTEDRRLYLVMELLEGMDLETLVGQHGPMPAARVVHVLTQVCESLEEAHAAGLIHRDIKPANIHLGRVGLRYDFVKVLDFGLVKSATGTRDEHSLATAAGFTPGTPAYMAPEMVDEAAVDGRADIYALGCVAYFLLTGQLVFEAFSALQMIARQLQEAPVPPSRRTNNPIPESLERLVLACLAKKPSQRPQSAGELARSLMATGITGWTEDQAREWWKTATQTSPPQAS